MFEVGLTWHVMIRISRGGGRDGMGNRGREIGRICSDIGSDIDRCQIRGYCQSVNSTVTNMGRADGNRAAGWWMDG